MKNIFSKQVLIFVVVGVLVVLATIVWAAKPQDPHGVDDITLCHATGNVNNPYSLVSVGKGSALKHTRHTGPIYTPGATEWGDIIPWFSYKGTDFMGLNWPEGEAIVAAGCVI